MIARAEAAMAVEAAAGHYLCVFEREGGNRMCVCVCMCAHAFECAFAAHAYLAH